MSESKSNLEDTYRSILEGTYTSPIGEEVSYGVYEFDTLPHQVYFIFKDNGYHSSIENIFPQGRGNFFTINKKDFENFKKNVVNDPLKYWTVTKIGENNIVEIPGTWSTDTRGGKRSGHKRSGHKRSKSQKKRKSHKHSGHKHSGKSRRH
jgi:hypothetical protein